MAGVGGHDLRVGQPAGFPGAARDIPVLIVANKSDLKKANLKKVQAAFPQYPVVGISAKYGRNVKDLYENVFDLIK